MSTLDKIAIKIITEQELVIGPLAWVEAGKVHGLKIVDQKKKEINLEGDDKVVVDHLVKQYERLFGRASKEVCKEAAASLLSHLSPEEVPASLK